jgi:hypothetical protein
LTLFASVERIALRRPDDAARRGSRVHAALTALAFVLSSLFGVLHDASTTHVRCAQHGELMHGSAMLVDGQLPIEAGMRQAVGAVAQGHEHCALASAMRESRMAPSPPALVPAPLASAALAVAIAYDGAARERGVYRTAPKTSPPTQAT